MSCEVLDQAQAARTFEEVLHRQPVRLEAHRHDELPFCFKSESSRSYDNTFLSALPIIAPLKSRICEGVTAL